MNIQEQVARLEALLGRVQRNAVLLQRERGLQEDVGSAGFSASREPHAEHEQQWERPYESQVKTLPPPPSRSSMEPPMVAVSNGLNPSEPRESPSFRDDTREHTKPLWLGVDGVTTTGSGATSSLPPESVTAIEGSFSLSAAARKTGSAQEPPLEEVSAAELDALESSPPLSGERASARSPFESLEAEPTSFQVPVSLEEPLRSAPLGAVGPDSFSEAGDTFDISTSDFDAAAEFAEDRESRISDAPASALGATISLPEGDAENVELELAEPPPSSLRLMAPPPEPPGGDELEVDLPRTSYRAAYDDSLSAPPKAIEELAAHDQSVRDRLSSKPAPSGAASPAARQTSGLPRPDDDLPPVLSTRPQPSVVAPESRSSTSARPGATFAPGEGQRAASFEGRFAAPTSSFLSLLDDSLALNVRR